MKARDVMTTMVVTVAPDSGVREIARLLLKHRISAAPVVDDRGRVIGMVSEGDLLRRPESGTEGHKSWWLDLLEGTEGRARSYLKSHGLAAGDVMTRKVITTDENAPLEKIATLLERNHIKRVPVLRRGKLVGIVSRANLLHGLVARGGSVTRRSRPDSKRIRAELTAELRHVGLRTDYLNVVVEDGVAHLWGWVESPAERKAVALAARRMPDIRRVDNHLSIKPVVTFGVE